jgi:hypothetical protein
MGTFPDRDGARGGVEAVLCILRRTGSDVIGRTVGVPIATQAFDEQLRLVDPRARPEVASLIAELADRAREAARLAE